MPRETITQGQARATFEVDGTELQLAQKFKLSSVSVKVNSDGTFKFSGSVNVTRIIKIPGVKVNITFGTATIDFPKFVSGNSGLLGRAANVLIVHNQNPCKGHC